METQNKKVNKVTNPTEIKKPDIEQINKTVEDYKDEISNEKPKRKYTKRNKIESEDVKAKAFSSIASVNFSLGFSLIINRLSPQNPLNEDEKKNLNSAFTELAEKYYSSISRFAPETNFLLAVVFVLLPRMNLIKSEKKIESTVEDNKENAKQNQFNIW